MINNITSLDNFWDFTEGTYYKFLCMHRNKDGGVQNNHIIKSWVVFSREYLEKCLPEMISMCKNFEGRLYFTVDKKSLKKSLCRIQEKTSKYIQELLFGSGLESVSVINKIFDSITQEEETSCGDKHILYDIDTEDELIIKNLIEAIDTEYVTSHSEEDLSNFKSSCFKYKTKNGYHLITPRKYNISKIGDLIKTKEFPIEIKTNALGLLFME